MTLNAAEKITGMTIVSSGIGFWRADGAMGQFDVRASNSKQAAERIVDWNWREICKSVFRAQQYHCAYCLRIRPLTGHHKIFRSAGRRDSVMNTEGLCSDCHGGKYGPHGRVS